MRTTDLLQRLQVARRELALESVLAKLDKYHLLILDDLAYVSKDQAETSVLLELIGTRYERRSMLITANQPFGEWGKVFPDQAMTLAAIVPVHGFETADCAYAANAIGVSCSARTAAGGLKPCRSMSHWVL
jgi:DNA replication protein DnaC